MIESWDPHYAIGPKLIEYVIYCLEQASMEDNLIGVIQLPFVLLELANAVLSDYLRSLLDDCHLLVYLVPVVLLVVLLEWL